MKCVIITGISGSGKTTALKFFEDIGYFCVDNLPPSLFPSLIELFNKPNCEIRNIAICIDIRCGNLFNEFFTYLSNQKNEKRLFEILFLDCCNEVLLKRYKETRRNHPLAKNESLISGISKERELLNYIRKKSDYIIDTSHTLARDLKQEINNIFIENKNFENFIITVLSFGFKYGCPTDADLIFDVRFLPNPFYIEELKYLTGNDAPVSEYVMKYEESKVFLEKLTDMAQFLIPNYIKEGKRQLIISIGCTGGRHRSVAIANALYKELLSKNYSVSLEHRDINEDINRGSRKL